ncbi:hypothetical protein [Streptomyces chryseus]
MPTPTTHVFRYDNAPVRARLVDGEAAWFLRDVAAATGARLPPRGLETLLPGVATTDQVAEVLQEAGCDVSALRAWMAEASAQLCARPARRLASVPQPRPAYNRRPAA